MAKKGNPLAVASKAIDPTLDALFASSAGPVTAPEKTRYAASRATRPSDAANGTDGQDTEMQDGDDEVLSEISEELDYGDDDEDDQSGGDDKSDDKAATAAEAAVDASRTKTERKRKRKDDNEDLEGNYLAELAREDEPSPSGKRQKPDENGSGEGSQDNDDDDDDDEKPLHETLTKDDKKAELDKAARTVFLANVSSEAISSKTAKKTLMKHLSSVLDADASPAEKLESLRFRSVAFAGGGMPKRAAFITKSFMEATTKSTNAYAVLSSAAAARKVAAQLNGSEVLGRHLRVDSVAHPSAMDHRRCVFVGNLGFVDDETVLNRTAEGEMVPKKRSKVPADVEEGLWRTFGTQGKVENVRVVRDPKTRVGKGFAYVQFYDGNDVEAALLLDGKKFPPMLPRPLRVTRAKDPRKTSSALDKARSKADAAEKASGRTKYAPKATPAAQAAAGRAGKLFGRAGAARQRSGDPSSGASPATGANGGALKTPQQVIFEGRRASSRDALPKDLKGKKGKGKGKGKGKKPTGRGASRASAWKQGKK